MEKSMDVGRKIRNVLRIFNFKWGKFIFRDKTVLAIETFKIASVSSLMQTEGEVEVEGPTFCFVEQITLFFKKGRILSFSANLIFLS